MNTDSTTRPSRVGARPPGRLSAGQGPAAAALYALTWTLACTAFHAYWFCGGRFGLGDASRPMPGVDSVGDAVFAILVAGMFAVGIWLPVAIVSGRNPHLTRPLIVTCIGIGSVLLLVRGTAGLFDQALRETGLATHGLTGLSYQQVTGDAHPSAYTLWSGVAVDAYFVLGGLLHGLLWLRLRTGTAVSPDSAIS